MDERPGTLKMRHIVPFEAEGATITAAVRCGPGNGPRPTDHRNYRPQAIRAGHFYYLSRKYIKLCLFLTLYCIPIVKANFTNLTYPCTACRHRVPTGHLLASCPIQFSLCANYCVPFYSKWRAQNLQNAPAEVAGPQTLLLV